MTGASQRPQSQLNCVVTTRQARPEKPRSSVSVFMARRCRPSPLFHVKNQGMESPNGADGGYSGLGLFDLQAGRRAGNGSSPSPSGGRCLPSFMCECAREDGRAMNYH